MFSGIVDHCGEICDIQSKNKGSILLIAHQFGRLELGESIAVNGVCLTVTEVALNRFACELSPETWQRTTAQYFKTNQPVHLAQAMRVDDRIGGHWVSGHVDGIINIADIQKHDDCLEVTFSKTNPEHFDYLIPKGSVAIDGVSLTVNEIHHERFNVMLIPHTLAITHFSSLQIGQAVNVEYDMLAKMVKQQINNYRSHYEAI